MPVRRRLGSIYTDMMRPPRALQGTRKRGEAWCSGKEGGQSQSGVKPAYPLGQRQLQRGAADLVTTISNWREGIQPFMENLLGQALGVQWCYKFFSYGIFSLVVGRRH